MAARRDRRPADPLAALPDHLRVANSPRFCAAGCCHPEMTVDQREDAEAVMAEWDAARAAWRQANGVGALEMMRLERFRPPPSKKARRSTPS